MRFFIFLFSIFILGGIFGSGIVGASGYSPSSLIYNLAPGEQSCQSILIESDSNTIAIFDSWTENKDVEWKVSEFNSGASEHGISISHPSTLTNERTFEVCLSGNEVGEFHGVILMKEEKQGNSVVQMGVWLKVTIEEGEAPVTENSQNNPGGSPSGGSSTTGNDTPENEVINLNKETPEDTEEPEPMGEVEDPSSKITGSAISGLVGNINWKSVLIAFAIIAILVFTYKRIRRSKLE